jgi:membrane protease YdiL (CAAX protease family)
MEFNNTQERITGMQSIHPPLQKSSAFHGLRQALQQHPLFYYFFMVYAFSWIMSIPCVLAEWGYLPEALFRPFFVIKAFAGPFLAAVIMVRLTEGKAGVERFRKRFFQARAGWQWYLFILAAIPALFLLGILVQPGAAASFHGFPNGRLVGYLVYYLINFVIIFFAGGPLAEEPGWRGFALPRMQNRYGPLAGALLLGLIWAFWHLPDFLTRAQGGGPGTGWGAFFTNLPIFTLLVVALSVILAWVYNRTQGSLFIAILLHASINTSGILVELFPAPSIPVFTMSNTALLVGIALPALLIALGTRGRLGFQQGMG